ncbi:MAG: hypothetical protein KDD66_15005 [Bdellovibrionales bacterium]|nr:hypothetical protein [Bdellovibrionales bacterium]
MDTEASFKQTRQNVLAVGIWLFVVLAMILFCAFLDGWGLPPPDDPGAIDSPGDSISSVESAEPAAPDKSVVPDGSVEVAIPFPDPNGGSCSYDFYLNVDASNFCANCGFAHSTEGSQQKESDF